MEVEKRKKLARHHETRLKFIEENTLNEEDEKAKQPEGLRIDLKDHQLTILKAMEKLEASNIAISEEETLHTKIGILADPTGAGKSIDIIALIVSKLLVPTTHHLIEQYGHDIYLTTTQNERQCLNTNLIVVPHSCTLQWKEYVSDYTDLPLLSITKKKEVDLFSCESYKQHKGIVLVSSSMYNAFANRCLGYFWSRIIYDEADTINIPAAIGLPGNFTWYISSSLHNLYFPSGMFYRNRIFSEDENGIVHRPHIIHIDGIRKTGHIRETFKNLEQRATNQSYKVITLKNSPIYVRNSFSIPAYIKLLVHCRSPLYIDVLDGVAGHEVLLCLNAGNVKGAIEKIGCQADSTENIITIFTESLQIEVANLQTQLDCTEKLLFTRDIDNENRSIKVQQLKNDIVDVEHKIACVKSRLTTDCCMICLDEIVQPTVLECCKNVFCLECLTCSLQHKSTCPTCRKHIDPTNMVVRSEEIKVHPKTVPTKHEMLINLIREKPQGKFLIFSSHDETFGKIEKNLDKNNIAFNKLIGSMAKIQNTITKYKQKDLNVLLLNAAHYGTGLNLENTTDVIIFHKMNPDLENQVIGRAQRAGRETSLYVHYLSYRNELNNI